MATEDEKNMMAMASFAQQQRMFDMQRKVEMENRMQALKIVQATDNAMAENIQLKKQMNLINIQNKKTDTINKARTQPVNLMERRTGKKKGGSVRNKRKKY